VALGSLVPPQLSSYEFTLALSFLPHNPLRREGEP